MDEIGHSTIKQGKLIGTHRCGIGLTGIVDKSATQHPVPPLVGVNKVYLVGLVIHGRIGLTTI